MRSHCLRTAVAMNGKGGGRTKRPGRAVATTLLQKPKAVARRAGLVYLLDDEAGIRRVRKGRGFAYLRPGGKPVRRENDLVRIRKLAIPPAWTDVWISPIAEAHLQATGRDARGRKQYRYHERWRGIRDATKFDRLAEFGAALPGIRARIDAALALPGLPREKVLAAVLHLLDVTCVRVGNEEYAEQNGSFGLTTLRNRHLRVEGSRLRLRFRGKSGVRHLVEIDDRRLARVVRRCSELPGELLFQYLDDDQMPRPVGSADVNDVLREWTQQDFTAKDFRTWSGSILFLEAACADDKDSSGIPELIRRVARRLNNTPAVCRKYYVHPVLMAVESNGGLAAERRTIRSRASGRLSAEERFLLRLLSARSFDAKTRARPA